MVIGLLHTTIRTDEKLLIEAAKKRNVKMMLIDVRESAFLPSILYNFDVVLERCVSTTKGNYAISFFESLNIPVVNSSRVAAICEDKFLTSLALYKNKVKEPQFAMVFNIDQAVITIEKMGGYPVVIKPTKGSWGRLLAKVNDSDALETILEHKTVLGSPQHKAFYIQQYIDKAGVDIRAFVIDGVVISAISRRSDHWINQSEHHEPRSSSSSEPD